MLVQECEAKPTVHLVAENKHWSMHVPLTHTNVLSSLDPSLFRVCFLHFSVLMKGITWSRDSHGLFDYESRHLTKKTLKASQEQMIMRSGNDLSLNPYNSNNSFQEQF